VTLEQCSPRSMGDNLCEGEVFLSGISCPKWVSRTWKVMKEVVQDITEQMKRFKECGI